MTTEHDALWRYQRDLEAERRHARPEHSRRELEAKAGRASDEAIHELMKDVIAWEAANPKVITGGYRHLSLITGRRTA